MLWPPLLHSEVGKHLIPEKQRRPLRRLARMLAAGKAEPLQHPPDCKSNLEVPLEGDKQQGGHRTGAAAPQGSPRQRPGGTNTSSSPHGSSQWHDHKMNTKGWSSGHPPSGRCLHGFKSQNPFSCLQATRFKYKDQKMESVTS